MPGSRPGFTPHFGWGSMAALDGDTLAYLTVREGEDEQGRFWEIGVIGHGPRASELADQVSTEIGEWDRGWGNTAPQPGFRMTVGDARDQLTAAEPRFVIDKTHSRLAVDWPRSSRTDDPNPRLTPTGAATVDGVPSSVRQGGE